MARAASSAKTAAAAHVAGPVEFEIFESVGEMVYREVQRCLRCDVLVKAGTRRVERDDVPMLGIPHPLQLGSGVVLEAVACR